MKRLNIPFMLAGLASLPATYTQTRGGSFLLSIGFICLIVAAAIFITHKMNIRGKRIYLSFILGALTSEIVLFGYWGVRTGYNDGYGLGFNFQLMAIEFLSLSLVGCTVIAILIQIMKHLSKPTASL
jgi:hypothetical protein